MTDVTGEIKAADRAVGDRPIAGGPGRSLILRRAYAAPVGDLWAACTTADRLGRWLGPVSGDLRPGGSFRVEGQASGRILRCEAPRLLVVTWEYGPDSVTEVELRLSPGEGGGAVLELCHTSPAETVDEIVRRLGPVGPIGIGAEWDLALLALERLTAGEDFDRAAWRGTPRGREFTVASYRAWGEEARAAWGLGEGEIAKTVDFLLRQAPPGEGEAAG
ncbi:SRPBCC domain-containing protein [Bailinhaonella thermotolerans]|uniref:Activator of Hsp90 ATPase homologue 1/2-like C-terminal domain-containing protein n=1 Tax=Bailinhaonella thermotolerans TaxID=1070861 RepID=A0A3A4ANU8_9ACTN|nr:SRPBCC domain-containing protein [Bailinhaonella thermotolerans]RJL23008.1 hypothetical protein D5H75_34075 [Bailinhaonella thermotolerans]